MIKQVFIVTDMHCSNCAMRIESIEDELAGVKSVSASYQKGRVVVEYDEKVLAPGEIVQAIKQKGYTATLP